MKVKILGNIEYQTIPITEDMIEIDDNILKEIGKTKQFDENGNIVDYVNNDIKIEELDNWFKNDYTTYEQMLSRRQRLGIEDEIVDSFRGKVYHNINELDLEAEEVSKEIRELRTEA